MCRKRRAPLARPAATAGASHTHPAMAIMAAATASLRSLAAAWPYNPWLLWGVGPTLSIGAGFFASAALFEALIRMPVLRDCLISYPAQGGPKPRMELVEKTQERIPFWKQVRGCAIVLFGPLAWVNGIVLAALMMWVAPGAHATGSFLPASAWDWAWQLLLLALVADFGLYWGHRVQHESELLWRFHRLHHSIDTPTPFSTLYIHNHDLTLQGGLPIALAAATVRPAPAVLYAFMAARIAENALNHSGLDSRLVDIFTLKFLPLRAGASHHDAHHKFCNHSRHARNYAESFWIWDYLFGTVSSLEGMRPDRLAAKGKAA